MNSDLPQNETHIDERGFIPAGLNACKECPFRRTNLDRVHPNPIMYSRGEVTRLWHGVAKEGKVSNCHMFDGDVHPWHEEYESHGYKRPANVGSNRECAGLATMLRRELEAIGQFATFDDYAKSRPLGLSEQAFRVAIQRLKSPVMPELRTGDYLDESVIMRPEEFLETDSVFWMLTDEQAERVVLALQAEFPSARNCDCEACSRHEQIHEARELVTAENIRVNVDTELWPLLQLMAERGIRTVDSCVNLRQVIESISQHAVSTIINGSNRRALNYEHTVRESAAFIRLRSTNDAEREFLAKVSKLPGVHILDGETITQIDFAAESLESVRGCL